jgi:glutamate N-acetyltransferase/amino-acid N-acetyltransferase
LADSLGIDKEDVLVAATGVIGEKFPIKKVVKGIKYNVQHLSKRRISGAMAANAIMTTDTFQKEAFTSFKLGKKQVSIGGIAKGSGMIHPDMATMLAFIVSDAAIEPDLLQDALSCAIKDSFNMISVDGDTSTSDMVLVLSNGFAENKRIIKKGREYEKFKKYLSNICKILAKSIVSDGEGATKFIEYRVVNAAFKEDARKIIRTVSDSNLVKTAVFGRDPNWGRIIAAMGRSGVDLNPDKINIFIGSKKILQVARNGAVVDFNRTKLKQMMKSSRIRIIMDLGQGDKECIGWGTDFSYDYVRINAEYTT